MCANSHAKKGGKGRQLHSSSGRLQPPQMRPHACVEAAPSTPRRLAPSRSLSRSLAEGKDVELALPQEGGGTAAQRHSGQHIWGTSSEGSSLERRRGAGEPEVGRARVGPSLELGFRDEFRCRPSAAEPKLVVPSRLLTELGHHSARELDSAAENSPGRTAVRLTPSFAKPFAPSSRATRLRSFDHPSGCPVESGEAACFVAGLCPLHSRFQQLHVLVQCSCCGDFPQASRMFAVLLLVVVVVYSSSSSG